MHLVSRSNLRFLPRWVRREEKDDNEPILVTGHPVLGTAPDTTQRNESDLSRPDTADTLVMSQDDGDSDADPAIPSADTDETRPDSGISVLP